MKKIIPLLLCLLLIISCELLNSAADPNYLDRLHEEIAWANAPRLNITVAYPTVWGTSLQRGTGRAGDTRVGYAFDIDFIPSPGYAFLEWQAYDTNKLNADYPNWINQASNVITDQNNEIKINSLRLMPQLPGIELPQFDLGGGTGKIKVKNSDVLDITLIPVSREQPRIVSSTPDNTTENYKNNGAITIVFASSIRGSTAVFENNNIMIFSQVYEPETNTYGPLVQMPLNEEDAYYNYKGQLYNDNTKTITINPKGNGPDVGTLITLYLGNQIRNTNGRSLEPVEIKWIVSEETLNVINPYAYYDENEGKIVVEWDSEGTVVTSEVSWFTDDGDYGDSSPLTGDIREFVIGSVPESTYNNPDTIRIYEIKISLFNAEGYKVEMGNQPLMILNVAGSKSSGGEEYTFVRNESDLRNARLDEIILLMNDINVSNWTPLGRDIAFSGTLYGFNNTITVNSFASNLGNNASYGLFWHISNARIFHLNINYNSINITLADDVTRATAGGIAGGITGSNVETCSFINGFTINVGAVFPNSPFLLVDNEERGLDARFGFALDAPPEVIHNIQIIPRYIVNSNTDPNPSNTAIQGTLRQALHFSNVNHIIFTGVIPGTSTINLTSALPIINRNILIEGNGITIARTGTTDFRLLTKNSGNVTIRGVHFRGGNSGAAHGGAILNTSGNLTLGSCIFSNNRTNGATGNHGGAIYQTGTGTLTIMGCTFYNNHANRGGAITVDNGSMTITGNLFYGNTASGGMPVVNRGVIPITSSRNVVDVPLNTTSGALANSHSGFSGTGDRSIPSVPLIVTASGEHYLKPHDFANGAAGAIPVSRPAGYPTVDFYGVQIPSGTAYAGAIQENVTASIRYVIISSTDPANLRNAITNANTRTGDVIVFSGVVPGATSIYFPNNNPIPEITSDMTILGNGIRIDGPGYNQNNFNWGNPSDVTDTSQLLRIGTDSTTRPTVIIERVHFRGGRASQNGAAIQNWGTVTLRSCIFSNNYVWKGDEKTYGGAILNQGGAEMTVIGCTFFANVVRGTGGAQGAAIYNSGTLTITGNIFYGNNSFNNDSHIIHGDNHNEWGIYLYSNGYNIVDRALGQGEHNAGYNNAPNTDRTLPNVGITSDYYHGLSGGYGTNISLTSAPFDTTTFVPVTTGTMHTHIPSRTWTISGRAASMPETDFYGKTRTWPGAPGAVMQPLP